MTNFVLCFCADDPRIKHATDDSDDTTEEEPDAKARKVAKEKVPVSSAFVPYEKL